MNGSNIAIYLRHLANDSKHQDPRITAQLLEKLILKINMGEFDN